MIRPLFGLISSGRLRMKWSMTRFPVVRRKLFNLAADVSLALCMATVVLWSGSYFSHGRIALAFNRSHLLVEVVPGKLAFVTFSQDYFSIPSGYGLDWIYFNADHAWALMGIRHYTCDFVTVTDVSLVSVILAASLLPLLRFRGDGQRRRRIRIG